MKIWIVSDGEPLPIDNENVRLRRMGNLANILSERGHEVCWFSSNFEHYNKAFRTNTDAVFPVENNYKIVLLATKGYRRNVSLARLVHFKMFAKKFASVARQLSKPNVILTTMAPIQASKEVERYAIENKVPYVVDIRDLWPEIYYEVTPKVTHPIVKLLVENNIKTLREILRNSTGIAGVTVKFLEYGLTVANLEQRKNDAVFHTAYPDIVNSAADSENVWLEKGVKPNDFVVAFVGNFGKQFDLETVFKAIDLIDETDIKFVLCGVGEKYDYYMERYNNDSRVILPGWVGKNEIVSLLKSSSIGIAPYIDSINFRLNMPNKFGEYLSASLPILVGVPGMMEKMLTENNNGYYYKNEYELRDEILKLYHHPQLHDQMAATSRRLYMEQFNVDTVYNQFADYLENMAEQ